MQASRIRMNVSKHSQMHFVSSVRFSHHTQRTALYCTGRKEAQGQNRCSMPCHATNSKTSTCIKNYLTHSLRLHPRLQHAFDLIERQLDVFAADVIIRDCADHITVDGHHFDGHPRAVVHPIRRLRPFAVLNRLSDAAVSQLMCVAGAQQKLTQLCSRYLGCPEHDNIRLHRPLDRHAVRGHPGQTVRQHFCIGVVLVQPCGHLRE
mmetsp:Transcript_42695/g.106638  ORF Transcript_42695/g.106638 Transcript_42695/m.106638 type:complete len:206 (-) Transcript_42695:2618-3235(-)